MLNHSRIDCGFVFVDVSTEVNVVDFTYIDHEKVIDAMRELEKHIGVTFNDIIWLVKAMNATPLQKRENAGKNKRRDYTNSALATVGDAILKAILSDVIFSNGKNDIRKEEITKQREKIENNDILFTVMGLANLKQFTYNEYGFYGDFLPNHESVSDCKHNQYIEAIIAAIYYDQGYDKTKEWVVYYLLPKLKECATCSRKKDCITRGYPICFKKTH